MAVSWKRTYQQELEALAEELEALSAVVEGIRDDECSRPTRLRVAPGAEPWSVMALLAHIDISIGMLPDLTAESLDGPPEKDRVTFFINDASVVKPIVDQYARDLAASRTPMDMRQAVLATLARTVAAARAGSPEQVGPSFFGSMRLDEFLPTRTVEAVVHGHDLSEALGRPPQMTPSARDTTVEILEQLLAQRAGGTRPADLSDDLAFVEVATGRRAHPDPSFPVLQ